MSVAIDTPASPGAAPALQLLCRIVARVAPLVSLGDGPYGERRCVPIVGGSVTGPVLNGEVLAGGMDWQVQRRDGTLDIAAQYMLRTGDGALIEVRSNGYRHGPLDVMARLAAGAAVGADEYYFRTAMTFQTGSPAWAHLNSVLAVGKAARQPDAAVLDVYLVG